MTTEIITTPETAQLPAAAPQGFDRFIEMAITKNVPVETLERLLAMQKDIMATNAKAAYDDALAAFQKVCPIIHKGKEVRNSPAKGGGLRYTYAPMDSIISQVREPLSAHGFSYSADTEIDEKGWIVTKVTSYHIAGHSRTTTFKVPVDKDAFMNEQQKVAAARTYALRYNFVGHFGIMTGDEDDDANSAGKDREAGKPGPAPAPGPAAQTTPPVDKPNAPPAPQPPAQPDGKLTVRGQITNVEDLPAKGKIDTWKKKNPPTDGETVEQYNARATKDGDNCRYKITLAGQPKPFYSFDKKIRALCHENAANSDAVVTYHVGQYGQDIDSISFPDVDMKSFIDNPENQK